MITYAGRGELLTSQGLSWLRKRNIIDLLYIPPAFGRLRSEDADVV